MQARTLAASEHRRQTITDWPEQTLQSNVLQLADRLGWLVYHTHDSRRSEPGFPDLVLVHPVKKQLLFRELKRTKGVISAAQTKWLGTLRTAGHDAKIWRPADWLDGSIENELKGLTA